MNTDEITVSNPREFAMTFRRKLLIFHSRKTSSQYVESSNLSGTSSLANPTRPFKKGHREQIARLRERILPARHTEAIHNLNC